MTKVYNVWAKEGTEKLYFKTLDCDAKFEEKLTFGLENDMRNLANFHNRAHEVLKVRTFIGFMQSRKCMRLKLRGELCFLAMKNDLKFEIELTCHFNIDMRNLTNFDSSTQKCQKFAL